MTKEEAIKYLQQLYPNGGHCWLDEQRMEAVGMAIRALQEEPVSEKKCMFTKDSYTDEDRNVLCEDCKEKCEYNKKEEPVSVGLEEAAWQYYDRNRLPIPPEWDLHKEFIDFFKAGAEWQKQQMMANAIDVEVKVDAGGYPYIPQMELYDYDKDVPLAKAGDRYEVVLIKEE